MGNLMKKKFKNEYEIRKYLYQIFTKNLTENQKIDSIIEHDVYTKELKDDILELLTFIQEDKKVSNKIKNRITNFIYRNHLDLDMDFDKYITKQEKYDGHDQIQKS